MQKSIAQFYTQETPILIAVDCVIFGYQEGQLNILLIKRNFEPGLGQWSLMGGFLQGNETLDWAAKRILHQLTGLDNVYLEQLHAYSEVARDKAARVVSVAYYALIDIATSNEQLTKTQEAAWFSINNIPKLIFDHREMCDKAWKRLQRKSLSQPIGFELLPTKFTIPQLQQLYEAIHNENLDKRNFRKNILLSGLITKLEEKNKEGSKKGAFLYVFNTEKYAALTESGTSIQFK